VNIIFVIEGEEENGSGGFAAAIKSNIDWFKGTGKKEQLENLLGIIFNSYLFIFYCRCVVGVE